MSYDNGKNCSNSSAALVQVQWKNLGKNGGTMLYAWKINWNKYLSNKFKHHVCFSYYLGRSVFWDKDFCVLRHASTMDYTLQ